MVSVIVLRPLLWQGAVMPANALLEVSDFQARELIGMGKAAIAPPPDKPAGPGKAKAKA
jgi:hypothetical protein